MSAVVIREKSSPRLDSFQTRRDEKNRQVCLIEVMEAQ
jgi:hypothetical protein